MTKTVGWAVGGAVVSITLGVLVGLVLHTGQTQRADRGPVPATASTSDTVTTGRTPTTPPSTRAPAAPLPPSPTAASPSASTGPTSRPPDAAGTSVLTPPATPTSAPNSGGPAGTAIDGTSVTSTAVTSTVVSGTTTAPRPGGDTAGAPCPTLAARSADATGTTLYCQVDQDDRALRWRAVVDKGGCLNQAMTGIGTDGREYQCRLDDSGRNHWAPAS